MTNKQIYMILHRLGMVEQDVSDQLCVYANDAERKLVQDKFQDEICKDIVSVTNFINDLFINNDVNCIKQFLTCMFIENSK